MAQEWNIRPRGHVCSICARPFEDRKPCVSVLREADGAYERFDCCPACWRDTPREWEPFSFWEGEYEAPASVTPKQEAVKRETAEGLLRRLITLEDPAMGDAVYVLAVMLERSRQLVERDAKPHESGGILRVYEHKKSGDTFVVLDPRLRLDQLGAVQQQVVALLSGTHALDTRPEPETGAPAEPVPGTE
ncbi:MAG: hypothetical protein RBT78_12035 [Kiritimatiellia bacterium]|jgi:hypothetical protein|nr:hypothetical protein [Kiritimatiellia bacterium]